MIDLYRCLMRVLVPLVKYIDCLYLSPPLDNIRRSDSIGEIDVTIQGDFLPCYGSYVRSIRVSRYCKKKINVS